MSYINEYYHTLKKTSSSLSVYQCGYQICGPGHTYGPAVRDHFVLHYVIQGKGVYHVEHQKFSIEAGTGFLIVPGQTTTYYADHTHPWRYYWVGFHGTEAVRLLNLCHLDQQHLLFSYTKDNQLKNLFSDLYYASKAYPYRELAMIGYLYLCFSCLSSQTKHLCEPLVQTYLNRAVQYIEEHANHSISVQDVADYVGLERSYLFRIFKQYFQCSVHTYIQKYKVEQAQLLLKQGHSVTEVSNSLGFDSVSYFSKVFKKISGCPPSHYRHGKNQ